MTSIHLLEEHSLDNTDKTATKIRWVATTRIWRESMGQIPWIWQTYLTGSIRRYVPCLSLTIDQNSSGTSQIPRGSIWQSVPCWSFQDDDKNSSGTTQILWGSIKQSVPCLSFQHDLIIDQNSPWGMNTARLDIVVGEERRRVGVKAMAAVRMWERRWREQQRISAAGGLVTYLCRVHVTILIQFSDCLYGWAYQNQQKSPHVSTLNNQPTCLDLVHDYS